MNESAGSSTLVRPRSLVLTGFMATGKSTLGRLVASRLRYGFVDTDRLIEERHGSVAAIFQREGEAAFRQLERDLARELAALPALVIATGGGMLVDASVADIFEDAGALIVCLTADVETIYRRVGGENAGARRPLLNVANPKQRIEELMEERANAYARFTQVTTAGRRTSAVVDEISALIAG
jgi:shikimate kinase